MTDCNVEPFCVNITQKNLISITCAYIHDISSTHVLEPLSESSKNVAGLLVCLENVFCHSLKGGSSRHKNMKIWHWAVQIYRQLPQNHIDLINNLDNLRNSLSKFRALLRLALQSKELHFYLDIAFKATAHLRKYYHPNSVLLSSEINRITEAAVELQYVDFCFDVRSDDLNFASVRQIDYTPYIRTDFGLVTISPEDRNNSSENAECLKCQEHAQNRDIYYSQKKYLEDTLNRMNDQLMQCRLTGSRLAHKNQVLRTAFDQLQTKFVLLNEEYLQELRRFGINSDLSCSNAQQSLQTACMSRHSNAATPPMAMGFEISEETDVVDLLSTEQADLIPIGQEVTSSFLPSSCPNNSPHLYRRSAPNNGMRTVVKPVAISPTPYFTEFPSANSSPLTTENKIGRQMFDECYKKYRLPDYEDLSPNQDDTPFDFERWTVEVKPKQTNFRCRYALPNFTDRRVSMPQPCLDLFSELQQTDSSFHLPRASSPPSSSEATFDQISDIEIDICPTSTSGVTTSTATIRALEEDLEEDKLPSTEHSYNPYTRSIEDCKDYHTLVSPSDRELNSTNEYTTSSDMKPKTMSTPKQSSNYVPD